MNHLKIEISATYLIKFFLIVGGLITMLYFGASLLMPLLIAAIIAVLLNQPTKKMVAWGFPRWLSITLSTLLLLVIMSLLMWLITSQVHAISSDWPTIKEKSIEKLDSLSMWTKEQFNVDLKDDLKNNEDVVQKVQTFASFFMSSIINMLSQSLIIFVYIILFLLQKDLFVNFFKKLSSNSQGAGYILSQSAKIIRSYSFGQGKIMLFLFGFYYLGFMLGSVPYALFLALFAALFSIIPYVGNIIGGGIAVVLAYLFSGGSSALIVIGVISVAQLLENYILTPWIIGDEINLNPFITIFGVILFSSLWGMVGAIISLPIIGVLKVVFENTHKLEIYAYLLKKNKE